MHSWLSPGSGVEDQRRCMWTGWSARLEERGIDQQIQQRVRLCRLRLKFKVLMQSISSKVSIIIGGNDLWWCSWAYFLLFGEVMHRSFCTFRWCSGALLIRTTTTKFRSPWIWSLRFSHAWGRPCRQNGGNQVLSWYRCKKDQGEMGKWMKNEKRKTTGMLDHFKTPLLKTIHMELCSSSQWHQCTYKVLATRKQTFGSAEPLLIPESHCAKAKENMTLLPTGTIDAYIGDSHCV